MRLRDYFWAFIPLFFATAPAATADDPPTPFSQAVTALTGDWEAEDWREGGLKLHPSIYTWQSDVHITFYAEEPAAGRDALSVAKLYFEGYDLGDDTLDPTLVSMRGAKELAPGILMVSYNWNYAYDDNVSQFGVITTKAGSFIPFRTNCERDDPDRQDEYRLELCIKKIITLMLAVQGAGTPEVSGKLQLPLPPSPVSIPGWTMSYMSDGTSVASSSNSFGTTRGSIMISSPRNIPEEQLPQAIMQFSEGLRDDVQDEGESVRPTAKWVGTTADPWLRREFPHDTYDQDDPPIIMAGSIRLPDGRIALAGTRCPNKNWLKSCSDGIEQAKLQVKSGIAEFRQKAIVAATLRPLPTDGIRDAQIAGIYTRGRNSVGYGGYMTGYTIDNFLLLKDGSFCDCVEAPFAFINPARDRPKNPGEWGKWSRQGNKIALRWDGGETDMIEVDGKNLMVGGTAATRINGYFRHVSGGGNQAFGGASGYLNQSSYTFFADGTFATDSSSSFMMGGGTMADGPDVVGGSSSGGTRGRYEIDGYTMTLTYPDGRVSHVAFAQYAHEMSGSKRDWIMINGTLYFHDDDE
ncbi:MAG: hypothetical protein HC843_04715 [Sphingomonadales bacterium]|nr:hypothetical protein [Sphingomonadales bacterium]